MKLRKPISVTQVTGTSARLHTDVRVVKSEGLRVKGDGLNPRDPDEVYVDHADPIVELPTFAPYAWPSLLQQMMDLGETDRQRDVIFLASLGTMGCMLNYHAFFDYRKRFYPALQNVVVGPPASNKSMMMLARQLIVPLDIEYDREREKERQRYQQEKADYEALGKERKGKPFPQPPLVKSPIIPADNTAAGMIENIINNEGWGLMCEPELDTLNTALQNTQWGNHSSQIRNCFDGSGLSFYRKTDHELRKVARTCVSFDLSGTPKQLVTYIPATENGLFSRQLFYYVTADAKWKSQFEGRIKDIDHAALQIGFRWHKMCKDLLAYGNYHLLLTEEQQSRLNQVLSDLLQRSRVVNGQELDSWVRRLAIDLQRILLIVSVLRVGDAIEADSSSLPLPRICGLVSMPQDIHPENQRDGICSCYDLRADAADFEAVMQLAEPLYRHAQHILSFLPPTEMHRRTSAERQQVFDAMPEDFVFADFKAKVVELGFNEDNAKSWLSRIKKRGGVTQDATSTYHKK